MQECEKMAAAATAAKEWLVALRALREGHSCMDLLGRLRGKLQQPGLKHHLTPLPQPKSVADIDIAWHVATATNNFDPGEIARLKALVGANVVPAKQTVTACP
jgi:hypothetical protein